LNKFCVSWIILVKLMKIKHNFWIILAQKSGNYILELKIDDVSENVLEILLIIHRLNNNILFEKTCSSPRYIRANINVLIRVSNIYLLYQWLKYLPLIFFFNILKINKFIWNKKLGNFWNC
jgi:hypothetical protein